MPERVPTENESFCEFAMVKYKIFQCYIGATADADDSLEEYNLLNCCISASLIVERLMGSEKG